MRESRTYGSVRGALSNERPYRDRFAYNDVVRPQRLPRISSTLYGPPPAVAR
jgi:hypothetical protein